MAFRAFGPVFRPAAALIGRLRYAQKFVVVGLVLLLPLGFVAGAYVNLQRGQISFNAAERVGVRYLDPLVALLGQVAQARHDALTGDDDDTALDAALDAVETVDRPERTELDTARLWPAARGLIVAARDSTAGPVARHDSYNAAMNSLTALIVHVGDRSNLTLDTSLDTYYLTATLQFRLPLLLDYAGRGADAAVLATRKGDGGDTDALIDLGLTSGVISTNWVAIDRNVATFAASTTDAAARRRITVAFDRLKAITTTFAGTLTDAVTARNPALIPANASDPVRLAAADLATASAAELDRLIRVRMAGFQARARSIETTAALAGLLGAYLFVGFYLSVTRPIRQIVATLRAVAGGDLARRVTVDTHDELSYVARVMNETIATTEAATAGLAVQATHDTLTGLANRALALDRLDLALTRSRRSGTQLAVLFIDLDRFKPINDSLGHHAGDLVLRVIADRLTGRLRDVDTVARLAGDEFVVICEGFTDAADAIATAERVVAELSRPIRVGDGSAARDVTVGASVGIAYATANARTTPDDLIRDADVAMYRAKQRGRGRVEIFDDALRIAVEQRMQTQEELRHAIDDGQIVTYFQPVVDGATGIVGGFEALARWNHPVRGVLGPYAFIEVADENGLIVPLGAEVLRQACREAMTWPATVKIAVNMASAQVAHPSFIPAVVATLDETGLDADRLILEITETTMMADTEVTVAALSALRDLGVHLSVDDFGTGYSSLTYLRRFPVEIVKIDRSFVAGIGRDPEDEAIVEMVLNLAKALNLRVVAEGVETAEQVTWLRDRKCGRMQGYHFGRPMPAEEAADYLARSLPQRA